jgi:hypothetical protein
MAKQVAVIGTDPGTAGALCLLIPETKQIMFKKTTATGLDLYLWFKQIQQEYNLVVNMIELVGFIQGSAGKSTFSFGRAFERVQVIPEIAQVSVDFVRPKAWQKSVGIVTPDRLAGAGNSAARAKFIKNEVAAIATRLYPQAEIRGPKGGLLDGRSDALMIAHYAAQTVKF